MERNGPFNSDIVRIRILFQFAKTKVRERERERERCKVAISGEGWRKREREKDIKMGNIPVAVESNGSVGQNPKYKTNGRPSVTIDTEKAAFLRILPSSAGYYHQVSRPSWMH